MNIVKSIKEEINVGLLSTLALANSETVEKTAIALDTSIISILLTFMKRASTETGLHLLYKMTKDDEFGLNKPIDSTLVVDTINKISDEGNALLSKIIPDKKSPLITFVSSFSQVRNATANRTNGLAILLILNKLKEESKAKSLEIGGLAELFADQKDYLLESAPKNLIERLSQHIGLGNLISLGSTIITTSTTLSIKKDREQQKSIEDSGKYAGSESIGSSANEMPLKNWIIPAIFGVLVLIGAGYYYFSQSSTQDTEELETSEDSLIDINKIQSIDSLKKIRNDSLIVQPSDKIVVDQEEFSLPNGQKVLVEKGDLAYNIVKFLGDTTSNITRKTLVSNSATFEENGNEILSEKIENYNIIGKIMNAYPNSLLKVTVNTFNNNSTFNDKLGIKRAFAIKKVLMNKGIQSIRIDAVGKINDIAVTDKLKAKEVELTIMKK